MSLAAAALFVAATAAAFNATRHPITIALLAPAGADSESFRHQLADELRGRGYDAFLRDESMRDFRPARPIADYYIEVLGVGGTPARMAVDVGAGPLDVGVGRARVGASINVYDARTMTLIQAIDPSKKTTIVAPRAVFGGRSFFAALALPMVEWAQGRDAMRALAHDAAGDIDEALRH
jgi:hypothetical protein